MNPECDPQAHTKRSKRLPVFFWIIAGILILAGVGYATTTITDNSLTTTGTINSSQVNGVFYVQPGNASDIQAKINTAREGETIYIPAGTYATTTTIIVNKSVILRGQGEGTIINGSVGSDVLRITGTGASVSDMRIIQNNDANIVKIEGGNGNLLERLVIEGSNVNPSAERRGILVRSGNNNLIRLNDISGMMLDSGIRVDNSGNLDGNLIGYASGNIVVENYIHDLGNLSFSNSTASGTAIENEGQNTLNKSKKNIYANNIITRGTGHGVRLIECLNCVVESNVISEMNRTGIWIHDSHESTISGNSISSIYTDLNHDGIQLNLGSSHNIILGNMISGTSKNCIQLIENVTNNLLIGNSCKNYFLLAINDTSGGDNKIVANMEGTAANVRFINITNITDSNGNLHSPLMKEVSEREAFIIFEFNNESISGNIIYDASSKNNNAINQGSIYNESGFRMNGVNSNLTIADAPSQNVSTGKFTLLAGINAKPMGFTNQKILTKKNIVGWELQLRGSTGEIMFTVRDTDDSSTSNYFSGLGDLRDNKEHDVGIVVDDVGGTKTLNFYLDCELVSTQNFLQSDLGDSSPLVLGGTLNGTLSYAKGYKRAFSSEEMKRFCLQRKEREAFLSKANPVLPKLQLHANVTAVSCNADNNGGIYYDGSTKKHYGCNSTTWNALY